MVNQVLEILWEMCFSHGPMSQQTQYRFSFGPWNISEGADPFGPEVRAVFPHEEKIRLIPTTRVRGVQFHDDDVVPDLETLSPDQVLKKTATVKTMLGNQGLTPEFVAPRLWFPAQTVDGAYIE